MRTAITCTSTILGFLLCGCRPAATPRHDSAVRDSAGIAIVESVAPAWGPRDAWRLSDEPMLRIGQAEGDPPYLLLDAWSALRLAGGTIVVANAGTEELRFFDSAGRYLKTAGGRGGGPGEFMNLVWVYPFGEDSLVAWDDSPPRIVILDRSGTFGRSVRPAPHGGVLRGAFADGSLLLAEQARWSVPPREGRIRPPARAYRLDSLGRVADTLPTFPGTEFHFAVRERGGVAGRSFSPPPFGRRTVFAVAGQGFYAGSQDDFEIGYYDEHGTLETLVRWPGPDRSVTPDHIASYQRHRQDNSRNEDQRRRVARYLSEQTYPDLLPAFGGMLVDAAGNLWVEAYHLDWEATRRWMVFDRAHRMLGTVEVPAGLLVLQVGDDFVLGWTWDELDVESIVSYALIKPQ